MHVQNKPLDRLTVFCFLWAGQALIHQEFFKGWFLENDPIGWALSVLILGVLFRPRSLALFGVMLIMSLAHAWDRLPLISNHIFLECIVNITLLAGIVSTLYQRRHADRNGSWDMLGFADQGSRERLFENFAPILRTSMVLMYLFAFVAKLNSDFLILEVSAAVEMYGDLTRWFSFLPQGPWTGYAAIWGALAVEGPLPLLFMFRRF